MCPFKLYIAFLGMLILKTISKASGLTKSYFETLFYLMMHSEICDCILSSLGELEPAWILG